MYAKDNWRTKKTFKAMCLGKDARESLDYDGMHRYFSNDIVFVEGPFYPEPHRWYAQVTIQGGIIKEIQ